MNRSDIKLCVILYHLLSQVAALGTVLLVWCYRQYHATELGYDFWLGYLYSNAAVLIFVFVLWWATIPEDSKETELEAATRVAEQERREECQKQLAEFSANHADPLFGVFYCDDNSTPAPLNSPTISGYFAVKPELAESQNIKVTVYRHPDGFHDCQRRSYLHVMRNFKAIWESIYSEINQAHLECFGVGHDADSPVQLSAIKIGPDLNGRSPYKLSVAISITDDTGLDEQASIEIWLSQDRPTKIECSW